jgi:lauroyl/myristoyl acyltransferase
VPALSVPWILSVIYGLYWLNRQRRMLLKSRSPVNPGRCLYAFARNLMFMLSRPHAAAFEIKGSLRPAGNGAVMYSVHYGIWEMMPQVLRTKGFRIGIITNRYAAGSRHPLAVWADRFLHGWRSRNGVTVFYRNNPRAIVEFIKNGGIFAMLVDGSDLFSKFSKARKLAALCRVPLIPFAIYRRDGRGILDINCDLETLIARWPHDYAWFYRSRQVAA